MSEFEGKVAIVTGGARGQGAAEPRAFAAAGAAVIIGDILDAEGQHLAAEIGGQVTYHHLDVTDESAWIGVVAEYERRFGRLDVLVNNAGIVSFNRIADTSLEEFQRVVGTNLTGAFLGIKSACGLMGRSGGGAIVNISSINGIRAGGRTHAYTSSKWALRGLTKAAAVDLADQNIRVNAILPGVIDTAMVHGGDASTSEIEARWLPNLLVKRLGAVEDIAQAVLFLAGDRAGFITGADLVVDGGWTVPVRPGEG
ncbi:glucose 1-dehydrogenase [Frankia sp. Cas3]|uniref:SDR family NAD(P)-dependent oxidoreductase n=1 Tax=Frankia sp. Cas3 TaxID=3073926 RepID=UPI002AD45675|nr:glucose 1-dehydrogenase [Frankia sp. Cas3]